MKLITTLTLIVIMKISIAQVLFNKTYIKPDWDYADAVIERQDGNYLIAGSSQSQNLTDYDINIVLVDSIGNIIWNKYLGIADTLEFAYSIIETSDNNYLISGLTGNSYPYLIKFDSSGNLIWDKKFDSNGFCRGGYSVGETVDTNYFFVRPNYSFNSSTLFKTNLQGDTLWTRSYDTLSCFAAIQTLDSGFALIGNNTSMFNQEIKFIKTNSVGDTIWTKTYGGEGYDDATSIRQLPDNGYIIAGTFDPQIIDDESDTYIIRTNSIGDTVWTKRYFHFGTPGYIQKCLFDDGFILSTTRSYSSGFLNPIMYYIRITKLDSIGNLEWSKQFDGYTYSIGNNVTQTSDGGFLLTGYKDNSSSFADIILIKFDSIGNYDLSVIDYPNKKSSHVITYPNPANNEITFQLKSINEIKIKNLKIFNLLSQELKNIDDINETKFNMNLGEFTTGIYFYELRSIDDEINTGKFIMK